VYQPSDPFLVTFNQGQLSAAQMTTGALTINAAAITASLLPGDFNLNGTVDAADYSVWRNGLGTIYTPAQYTEWKTNFGRRLGSASIATVPEPAAAVLCFAVMWAASTTRFRAAKCNDSAAGVF
jgi:hypothetical protein